MVVDIAGCWVIEMVCKYMFADLEPKPLIMHGQEQREQRQKEQVRMADQAGAEAAEEKKSQ
ncbi:hypothetical protein JVT61DRAFT_10730 [Boletus reticuloceps]|uniref:Uncharacterized protein n=1 Tax=Boletus reticuloceps TaxID=495285 RepID=A0A8I2YFJ5_9AGAM|nr:hypothetical protein JVT61DRAFT_10730 [Boletus reticuloceps]